jgi:3-phenylpropionate/cinnamic acid dioxygenase small subunit
MSEHEDIRRTLADYCHFIDDQYLDHWADLFTSDATFTLLGRELGPGREVLRAFAHRRFAADPNSSKHVTTNTAISITGDRAKARSDFMVLMASPDGPVLRVAGRYVDELVREVDRWRFARRDVIVPPGWAPAG